MIDKHCVVSSTWETVSECKTICTQVVSVSRSQDVIEDEVSKERADVEDLVHADTCVQLMTDQSALHFPCKLSVTLLSKTSKKKKECGNTPVEGHKDADDEDDELNTAGFTCHSVAILSEAKNIELYLRDEYLKTIRCEKVEDIGELVMFRADFNLPARAGEVTTFELVLVPPNASITKSIWVYALQVTVRPVQQKSIKRETDEQHLSGGLSTGLGLDLLRGLTGSLVGLMPPSLPSLGRAVHNRQQLISSTSSEERQRQQQLFTSLLTAAASSSYSESAAASSLLMSELTIASSSRERSASTLNSLPAEQQDTGQEPRNCGDVEKRKNKSLLVPEEMATYSAAVASPSSFKSPLKGSCSNCRRNSSGDCKGDLSGVTVTALEDMSSTLIQYLDTRFEQVDKSLRQINQRLDKLEAKLS